MYNIPLIGQLMDRKNYEPTYRGEFGVLTRKRAREVYPFADLAVRVDGVVYFRVDITVETDDSLFPHMLVTKALIAVPLDGNTAYVHHEHEWTNESITNPDYLNKNATILKGSIDMFHKEYK